MSTPEIHAGMEEPSIKVGFLQYLFSKGLLSQREKEEIQKSATWQGGVPVRRILDICSVPEPRIYDQMAAFSRMRLHSMRELTISESVPRAMSSLLLKKFSVLPIDTDGQTLSVATPVPLSEDVQSKLADRAAAKAVKQFLVPLSEIQHTSGMTPTVHQQPEVVRQQEETKNALEMKAPKGFSAADKQRFKDLQQRLEAVLRETSNRGTQKEELQVTELLNVLIAYALINGSSDLHLEPREKVFAIRIRIDGKLRNVGTIPTNYKEALISRIKVLSDLDITERYRPQDGKFDFEFEGKRAELRVSVFRTIHGEKVVMRLLDHSGFEFKLSSLGLEANQEKLFKDMISNPYGIILVTGPTGSGKSTTLYTCLEQLNTHDVNITTIEDPVEKEIERVNQGHIVKTRGMDFHNSLRAILRQDPDVIMLGEIRDAETAEIAFQAALTGHLVFATVHTNDAVTTLDRLLNLGVDRAVVALGLVGVIAQRLVRKICPSCKETYEPDQQVLESLGIGDLEGVTFARGRGCGDCGYRGLKGRTAIFEFLPSTPELQDDIQHGRSVREMYTTARSTGWHPLRFAGLQKLLRHETTIEEVLLMTSSRMS